MRIWRTYRFGQDVANQHGGIRKRPGSNSHGSGHGSMGICWPLKTGGMLGLQYATQAPDSLTKLIAGGTSASKEYGADSGSIYCHKNPNFNRIMEIMNQLNDPATSVELRKQISRELASMSFYSEEKLDYAMTLPNSGKTVGDRLNYYIQSEFPTYDLREELLDVTVPSYIYAGKYDAMSI